MKTEPRSTWRTRESPFVWRVTGLMGSKRSRSECRYEGALAVVVQHLSTDWIAVVSSPRGMVTSPRCRFRTQAMAWAEHELTQLATQDGA